VASGTIATPVLAASAGISVVGSAGLVVLGAARALMSVAIMNRALRQGDDLPRPNVRPGQLGVSAR
jgi:hypothetical protein